MSVFARLASITSLLLVLLLAAIPSAGEDKMSAEDVVKRHLDSIGDSSVRAAKSRVMEGTATYKVLVGGTGQIDGKAVIVSEGAKSHFLLKIPTAQYTGEVFVSDGSKTSVAGTYPDKSRSEFGVFLRGEDQPLSEGLLGGVLTTAWPLFDLDAHKAKLKYQGIKKVDGVEYIALQYQPKKDADLEITLYFEPNTFRHARTIYTASLQAGLGRAGQTDVMAAPAEIAKAQTPGGGDVNSARQQQTRYRIEERFSDFKTVDGLTLPSHYDLRFQEELQSGFTKTVEWDVTTTRLLNNIPLDARNFEVH